jgi:hypothetical protein
VHVLRRMVIACTYGLPSGPNTMPLENFLGAGVSVACFSATSTCPGAIFPVVTRYYYGFVISLVLVMISKPDGVLRPCCTSGRSQTGISMHLQLRIFNVNSSWTGWLLHLSWCTVSLWRIRDKA